MGFFSRFRLPSVSATDAIRQVADGATLLDVRDNREWNAGHAPGAIHIPVDQVAATAGTPAAQGQAGRRRVPQRRSRARRHDDPARPGHRGGEPPRRHARLGVGGRSRGRQGQQARHHRLTRTSVGDMSTVAGPVLRVESLTKVFGRRSPVTAVADLSFDVQPGRVTGFLGPNGSGKTTTLRCLLGLVTPTSGQALVDGRPYATAGRSHPGGRRGPRGQRLPSRPDRPQPPARPRRGQRRRRRPRRRGPRAGRAHGVRPPTRGRVLAGHAPAPGPRRRPARPTRPP